MCTGALRVKQKSAYVNGAWVQPAMHSRRPMGTTAAKSKLDATYRAQVRDWLTLLQEQHGLKTQDALGAAMGRDRSTANRYLNLKVKPEYTVLMALADHVRDPIPREIVAAFHRLEGRDPPAQSERTSGPDVAIGAIRSMPIISTVAAGKLSDPTMQIEGEHQTIEIGGLPAGDYFATQVDGDSMDRLSPPGSTIIVDRAERDPLPGRRYIFGRRGKTTFKRFELDPIRLVPESTNPVHEPIYPKSDDEWQVIGRVRMTMLRNL